MPSNNNLKNIEKTLADTSNLEKDAKVDKNSGTTKEIEERKMNENNTDQNPKYIIYALYDFKKEQSKLQLMAHNNYY